MMAENTNIKRDDPVPNFRLASLRKFFFRQDRAELIEAILIPILNERTRFMGTKEDVQNLLQHCPKRKNALMANRSITQILDS